MENLENAILEIKKAMPGLKLLENEPMAGHCSFNIGGPARALAVPSDVVSLSEICYHLKNHKVAPFVLGNGTNILFPDEGLKDLFIISMEKLTNMHMTEDGAIYAEAGVSMAKLASFAQQNSLTGMECISGIPGSVGGGLFMNAGAYDGFIENSVESVVIYYLPEQRLYELTREQCAYGYRKSIFMTMPGCVILSGVFRMPEGSGEEIAAKMRELNEKRRSKQPLELPSAGSFFRRPEGNFAGALIEQAGLKGFRIGGAQVSEKHAGFIVNAGGATSHDVYELADHVRQTVYKQFNVTLAPECIILPPDYALVDNGPAIRGHQVWTNEALREELEKE